MPAITVADNVTTCPKMEGLGDAVSVDVVGAAYDMVKDRVSGRVFASGNVDSLTEALRDVTDPTTATAYSVGQQLFTTAWNILFACILVVWAFGWTGGKQLVGDSYEGAKAKAAEQKAARDARKAAKRKARAAETS